MGMRTSERVAICSAREGMPDFVDTDTISRNAFGSCRKLAMYVMDGSSSSASFKGPCAWQMCSK